MRKKELVKLVEAQKEQLKELDRNLSVLNHIVRYGKDSINIKLAAIRSIGFHLEFGLRVEYITKKYDPCIGEYEEVSSVTIDKSAAISLRHSPGYKVEWKILYNKDDIIIFTLTVTTNDKIHIVEKYIIDKDKNVICPYMEVKKNDKV